MDDNKMVAGKVKKPGKRGRKPAKIDLKAKLERSRQSARECRARKKLRYQYLEELVSSKERAICALREELEMNLTLNSCRCHGESVFTRCHGESVFTRCHGESQSSAEE
uniref:cAMP-responsive element-binding protein-like 2 n=1 Tax=Acanthochromis polyacanthus TaxID=80966 RepID=A0A3Q1F2N7_9TELE